MPRYGQILSGYSDRILLDVEAKLGQLTLIGLWDSPPVCSEKPVNKVHTSMDRASEPRDDWSNARVFNVRHPCSTTRVRLIEVIARGLQCTCYWLSD